MGKGVSNHAIDEKWKPSNIKPLLNWTFKISKNRCFGEKF
jgi:hypothetical protein